MWMYEHAPTDISNFLAEETWNEPKQRDYWAVISSSRHHLHTQAPVYPD